MPNIDEGQMIDLTTDATPNAWLKPAEANSALFGPGVPIQPLHQEEQPRQFEYRPGVNLYTIPRAGFGLAPFPMLRALGTACKEVRLNIELIKREIRALEWEIVPTEKNGDTTGLPEMQALFEAPDGETEFDQWNNMLLEEMLVIDAPALWLNTDGQRLTSVDIIAGDTLRPLLDKRGKIAAPPLPGFVQVLYGVPFSWFSKSRLLYKPFNSSITSPYGTSPIEFIILAVNLALRRDTYQVGSYTEGNIPEALMGMPSSWSQSQIEDWQKYWDSLVSGKLGQQKKLKFVPTEKGTGLPVYEFQKGSVDSTARDMWLMQIACWAYGNSPAEFGITGGAGLGGAGFMAGMENIQYRQMFGPITQYLEKIYRRIIRTAGYPNLKFSWKDVDPQRDATTQAQIDQIYVGLGAYGVDYIQDRDGIPDNYRKAAQPPTLPIPTAGGVSAGPTVLPAPAVDSGPSPYAVVNKRSPARRYTIVKRGDQHSIMDLTKTSDPIVFSGTYRQCDREIAKLVKAGAQGSDTPAPFRSTGQGQPPQDDWTIYG